VAEKKQSNTGLYVALAAAALLVVAAVVGTRFLSPAAPPPPPPAPPAPEHSVLTLLRYTDAYYRSVLDDGAKRFGLQPPELSELAAPLAHSVELNRARPLKLGESFETAHLKIGARAVKEWAVNGDNQGFRASHLVLTISNRTRRPLAYRVDTQVSHPEHCRTKGAIPHNAVAVGPGAAVERTECVERPGDTLAVTRVEVIELPPIGLPYVSKLDPSQIGLDPRTSDGHVPPGGKACQFIPRREIESSGAGWADVIDFYARHDCDEYSFFAGYRFRDRPGPLPARPPDSTAAPGADGGR
jgi:hypothetical protein